MTGFPQHAGNFTAGSRVGGYLLQEQIGQGGMAVVFLALDERLGRQVALKILAPALAADEAFRHRFIRESRAAATVDDPHIIPVFEAGDADGVLFIAMRYVRGGDVRSLLRREEALGAGRMAAIVSPIASALDAAHAAGLVHRDVKPANMLLDVRPGRPDHVYLSDFGLSKEAFEASALTKAGQFLGTVDYAAPEQVSGKLVDGQADQYALGCAAFEMLCGEPPFPRDQGMAVLYAHLSEPPPMISSRRPGLPSSLDRVFARVLAKSPADRFGTCAEFADALRHATGLAPYAPGQPATHPDTELARTTGGAGAFVTGPTQQPLPQLAPQAEPQYRAGNNPPYIPGLYGPYTPGQAYASGQAYAPGQPVPPYGTRRNRRWLLPTAVVAGAAGTVAIAAIAYSLITLASHASDNTALSGNSPPANASSGAVQATTPSASSSSAAPATSSPASSSNPAPVNSSGPATGTTTAPGSLTWSAYQDSSGFSIDLPTGWAESSATRTGNYPGVNFMGPPPGFGLFVSWSRITGPSALGSWQQLAAQNASNDPTYQQIRVQQVSYRGYDAAVWEFTNIRHGVLTHVIDWGFVVKPNKLGYAIELYGPQADWPTVYQSMWTQFLTSFQPSQLASP